VARTTFIQDARKFGIGWRLWFLLLTIVNLVAPLFFLGRPEAWAALGGYFVAAVVMIPIHRRLGWVRLLGVGHFQWLLLLPWLIYRYQATAPSGAFGAWMLAVIIVDGICLVIDVVDLVRYLRGDREPLPATGGRRNRIRHDAGADRQGPARKATTDRLWRRR